MKNKFSLSVLTRLNEWLDGAGNVGVAASGGVDSTTLAIVAHRRLSEKCKVYHASSPAVPKSATNRLATIAKAEGWQFEIINAGEFQDPNYLNNPVNRCFFCKKNLYRAIAAGGIAEEVLLSGTNTDDMADFRPGLQAAKAFQVKHPYVELGVNKAVVRKIAKHLGFEDLAELPASPCLSSRIETGIRVEPNTLLLVDQVERYLLSELLVSTVRCRVRAKGLVVELDQECLLTLTGTQKTVLREEIKRMAQLTKINLDFSIDFESYRQGSAFIRDEVR